MRRQAFTLLEVLCSLAISVMLLGALYVAVNTQLQSTQSSRQVLEHSTLVRTLLARITSDINANLGPATPDRSAAASTSSTTSGTTGTTTTGTSSTSSTTSSTTPTTTTTTGTAAQINYGVQGDSGRLTLYISRIHRDPRFVVPEMSGTDAVSVESDLRRVTYWLAGGTESPLGLARQVVRLVTSEDQMAALPPDIPDEANYLLAEEVRSLRFSYFDGTNWQDSWDGTTLGDDGVTPIGPPAAIAIVIGISRTRDVTAENNVREYRHVVAIPTANGPPQQMQNTTATGTSTTTP